jgi:hypothetical protein
MCLYETDGSPRLRAAAYQFCASPALIPKRLLRLGRRTAASFLLHLCVCLSLCESVLPPSSSTQPTGDAVFFRAYKSSEDLCERLVVKDGGWESLAHSQRWRTGKPRTESLVYLGAAGEAGLGAGPVPLVLDLRIAHDRLGSSSDPSINGILDYPNDIDRSLNEAVADKIRKYRADYNNRPPNAISFMPAIASTSDRLHSEFVRLFFISSSGN